MGQYGRSPPAGSFQLIKVLSYYFLWLKTVVSSAGTVDINNGVIIVVDPYFVIRIINYFEKCIVVQTIVSFFYHLTAPLTNPYYLQNLILKILPLICK